MSYGSRDEDNASDRGSGAEHHFEEEPDRCWICLGNDGDMPPLAHSSDSPHLIQVCLCSLKAHKRCLIDWATEVDFEHRREGRIRDTLVQNDVVHFVTRSNDGLAAVVGFRPRDGRRLFTSPYVHCPQCQREIVFAMRPSWLLSMQNLVMGVSDKVATSGLLSVVGSTVATSLAVSILSLLGSIGLHSWGVVAGESVLMKLMDLKERTFESALRANSVTLKNLFQLAGFPVYLHSLRSTDVISGIFGSFYPLLFAQRLFQGPKTSVVLLKLASFAYNTGYTFTFNRFYFRLLTQAKPWLIADKLPVEELEVIEKENTIMCQLLDLRKENTPKGLPWYKRSWNWLFPNYTDEEREIIRHRSQRENRAIIARDYSSLFQKESTCWRFTTTCLWPYAGTAVGTLLGRYTPLNKWLIPYVNTPAEGTYWKNIIGMCLVALCHDLWKLYLAWKEVQQYKELDVLDDEMTGLEMSCITSMRLGPNEALPSQEIMNLHMRQHEAPQNIEANANAQQNIAFEGWPGYLPDFAQNNR